MTQIQRRKGQQVGARIRAEAAVRDARDVLTQTEIATELNIARETLRQFRVGPDSDLYACWVEIARRRIAAGIAHDRIVNELVETLAPRLEMRTPTAAEGWEILRRTARILSGAFEDWNNTRGGDEDPLEEDPDRLLVLAAAHVGETNLAPGCQKQDQIIKVMLDACTTVPAHDRGSLVAMTGKFIPWRM